MKVPKNDRSMKVAFLFTVSKLGVSYDIYG